MSGLIFKCLIYNNFSFQEALSDFDFGVTHFRGWQKLGKHDYVNAHKLNRLPQKTYQIKVSWLQLHSNSKEWYGNHGSYYPKGQHHFQLKMLLNMYGSPLILTNWALNPTPLGTVWVGWDVVGSLWGVRRHTGRGSKLGETQHNQTFPFLSTSFGARTKWWMMWQM